MLCVHPWEVMGLHDMQMSPTISGSQSNQIVLLSANPLGNLSYETYKENANTQFSTLNTILSDGRSD